MQRPGSGIEMYGTKVQEHHSDIAQRTKRASR